MHNFAGNRLKHTRIPVVFNDLILSIISACCRPDKFCNFGMKLLSMPSGLLLLLWPNGIGDLFEC